MREVEVLVTVQFRGDGAVRRGADPRSYSAGDAEYEAAIAARDAMEGVMKFKPGDLVQVNNGAVWEVVDICESTMSVRTYPDGKRVYGTVLDNNWQLIGGHLLMGGSDEYDEVMQAQAAMEGL